MDRDLVYEPPAAVEPQGPTPAQLGVLLVGTTSAAASTTFAHGSVGNLVFSVTGVLGCSTFLYLIFSQLIRDIRRRRG